MTDSCSSSGKNNFDLVTVSVLMTAYNREKYIARSIESVLASGFRDFELIICDDGSADGTVAIARGFAEKDKRVSVHVNESNLGDYPNRNRAASLAKGKYLKYVDSDDIIYPWALGCLVRMMEAHPEAGWGLCSMEPHPGRMFPFTLMPSETFRYHYFGPGLFRRAPLSSIIRRDLFAEAGGFRPLRMVGDFDMWQRMAVLSPVLLMPEGMVWYRRHEEQEIRYFSDFLIQYEKYKLEHLLQPSCPLNRKEVSEVIRSERGKIIRHLFACLKRLKMKEFRLYFKMFLIYFNRPIKTAL